MEKAKHELAEVDYMAGLKYQQIADKYGVSIKTVEKWKSRYGWNRKKPYKNPTRAAAQKGNTNRAAPKGNKRAERFGFYSKYLPAETAEIVFQDEKPIEVLWVQIRFAHAALLRAQRIAYEKLEAGENEPERQWMKQESFIKAQARAQATLNNLIKQYDELINKRGELTSEEQCARIEKLKAETSAANTTVEENAMNTEAWKDAIILAAKRREQDDSEPE